MLLTRILERTAERVINLEETFPVEKISGNRSLKEAILGANGRNAVIAELKYSSPTRGTIRVGPAPQELARVLIEGGCTALSVLTEPSFFGGDVNCLRKVREISTVPVLRKDFIIDEKQLYETKALNADAVLLIARILGAKIPSFVKLSRKLGLEPLVEIRNEEEMALALATGTELIGINNRNLSTMKIDLKTTLRLSELARNEGRLVVSESGMNWPYNIRYIKGHCDAFLIGSAIMASKHPREKLEGFVSA
jgi:indole-3-glycerol phosphate synthase